MTDDFKPEGWLKWISIELILSLVAMAFTVGATYMALASDIEDAEDKAQKNTAKLEAQSKAIGEIKLDTAITKEKVSSMEKEMQRQGETLNEIRRMILEDRRS